MHSVFLKKWAILTVAQGANWILAFFENGCHCVPLSTRSARLLACLLRAFMELGVWVHLIHNLAIL